MSSHKFSYNPLLVSLFILLINNTKVFSKIETRIAGGKAVAPGRIPYIAFLYPGSDDYFFPCGGTLISDRFVLTAAHCVCYKGNATLVPSLDVSLGVTNKNIVDNKGIKYHVTQENIIRHHLYSFSPFIRNDIALVRLPQSVIFTKFIQPAFLPTSNDINLDNQKLISSGWGKTAENSLRSEILMFMETKVVPKPNCSNIWRDLYDSKTQLCINAPGRKICLGDSGGPHVLVKNGRNILVGITDFNDGNCIASEVPQILTRVTYFLDWIEQHTGIYMYL